jgi:hypothetical protein
VTKLLDSRWESQEEEEQAEEKATMEEKEEEANEKEREGGNLTVVEDVFQLHKPDPSFTVPAGDELVIHLRLGDVIERSQAEVETMLMKGADPSHNKNFKTAIKSIHEYLTDIQESGLDKVVIRGGSHKTKFYENSRVYAGCLKEAIGNAGYHVSMEVEGNTPDQDFFHESCNKSDSFHWRLFTVDREDG